MSSHPKVGLFVSLFVLVGFPVVFSLISWITGEWNYLFYSVIPAFFAGFTGLLISVQQIKKTMV
jgi:hypothetical protein